jgi:hypothetical protein
MGGLVSYLRKSWNPNVTPTGANSGYRVLVGRDLNTDLIEEALSELEDKLADLNQHDQTRISAIVSEVRTNIQSPIPTNQVLPLVSSIRAMSNFITLHEHDKKDLSYQTTSIKMAACRTLSGLAVGLISGALIAAGGEGGFDEEESRGPVLMFGAACFAAAAVNEVISLCGGHKNQSSRLQAELKDGIDVFAEKTREIQHAIEQSTADELQANIAAEVDEKTRQLKLHLRIVSNSLYTLAANSIDRHNRAYALHQELDPLIVDLNRNTKLSTEQLGKINDLSDAVDIYQRTLTRSNFNFEQKREGILATLKESRNEADLIIKSIYDFVNTTSEQVMVSPRLTASPY